MRLTFNSAAQWGNRGSSVNTDRGSSVNTDRGQKKQIPLLKSRQAFPTDFFGKRKSKN